MNKEYNKIKLKKLYTFFMAIVLLAMVFSSCGKKDADNNVIDPAGQTDMNGLMGPDGNIITNPNDSYADLFSLPRPEFDWRENVYSEYALDFKLDEVEPYHIFDVNTVNGKILAVAKINVETVATDVVNYRLAIIDNDDVNNPKMLEIPDAVTLFGNSGGNDVAIIDSGYSGVKVCHDGSILGMYYGTTCFVNAAGDLEMSGVRYMTHWASDGTILWNTDVSEYLSKEYGFVKYANLLSDGRTVVFTECDKIYGFVINIDGSIAVGREIGSDEGLYNVSDIEGTADGRDVVFYNKTYKESVYVGTPAEPENADEDVDSIEAVNNANESANNADGAIEYIRYEQFFVDAAYLDADTLTLRDGAVIPYEIKKNDYYSINRGVGKDFIYTNEIGVFAFNIGDTEAVPVMNYVNSDFRGYFFTDIAAVSSDELMGIFTTYDEGIMIAAGFKAVDKATLNGIETVKLGVFGLDDKLKRLVREYNNSQSGYRLIIEDYSQLEIENISIDEAQNYIIDDRLGEEAADYSGEVIVTESDYQTYLKKLQLAQLRQDILNRTGPDLIMVDPNLFDYCGLADTGLLVEFEELAAEDVELSGANGDKLDEAYLMNVMDAYAIDGKHYLYMYDFYYNIFTGRASSRILPSNTGWSIIDFDITYSPYHVGGTSLMAYDLNNAPVMIAYKTRTQFVDIMTRYTGSEFVNMDTGLCEFDSEDFISLLKYAGSLAVSNDDSLPVYSDISVSYRNDSVLINENLLGMGTPEGFWSDMCRNFDGDFSCIGFPSRSGNAGKSGTISMAELPIAIIRNGNVDGAWSFAREFFCDKYQNGIINRGCGIPVLKDSFDAWFSEGMSRSAGLYCVDESGNNVFCPNTYIAGGQYCTVSYMMEDDALLVKESIMACDEREFTNPAITQIIKEETDRFFAGGITAEETAENIQKRVTEYLEEQ